MNCVGNWFRRSKIKRGTELEPEPPVTPIGMGKSTRGLELTFVNDLDDRLVASWMKQAATMPFVGGRSQDR